MERAPAVLGTQAGALRSGLPSCAGHVMVEVATRLGLPVPKFEAGLWSWRS